MGFHKLDVNDLELVLGRAASQGLVTIINGNVQILNGTLPVSASACQQPIPSNPQTVHALPN